MKDLLQSLVRAQRVDERLATLRRRSESLPTELAEREAQHAALEAEVESFDNERKAALARSKELEIEVQTREERIAKVEAQARESRDAAAVQIALHEAQEHRDQVAEAENEALILLERAEELATARDEAQQAVDASQQELEMFRETVAADRTELQSEIDGLSAERETILAPTSGTLRDVYEKLLPARKGRALAPLKGDCCGGCGMVVPPNDRVGVVKASEAVRCRSCTRILVGMEMWTEDDASAQAADSGAS